MASTARRASESQTTQLAECRRLEQDARRTEHWKRWGPYLSERAWGTVREDYSSGTVGLPVRWNPRKPRGRVGARRGVNAAFAGINVVRMAEFTWGLCAPEDGKFDFGWLKRVIDLLGKAGIQVVLATPTAAPPIWLAQKHPEILPVDEHGLIKREGTHRAACLASDTYWDYSRRIVENMAKALGQHPQLIAWQIDNGLGGNCTEASFNEDARREWHLWLEAKYETIEGLNNAMGLRHWGVSA